MARQRIRRILTRFTSRRFAVLLSAALIAALLTLITNKLPQFDLIEAQLNDENFTDLVLKTRGELPIDTNILVVTYDQRMAAAGHTLGLTIEAPK